MKKIISVFSVLALCASLTACTATPESSAVNQNAESNNNQEGVASSSDSNSITATDSDLASAKLYLKTKYKDKAVLIADDYKVDSSIRVNGISFPVEWTVSITDGDKRAVSVNPEAVDGKYTIEVSQEATCLTSYDLIATIYNPSDLTKTEIISFSHTVPTGSIGDLCTAAVIDKCQALDSSNTSIAGTQVVRGTITKHTYNTNYKNSNTYIDVDGYSIYCYAMGDETTADLKEGDVITVWGSLMYYAKDNVVEFAKGCKYSLTESVEDVKMKVILDDAAELKRDESLPNTVVLQGTVSEITEAYSSNFDYITVNVDVFGTSVECYRLSGGSDLAVGDKIVISGNITNFKDRIRFAAGSTYSKTLTVEAAKDICVINKAGNLSDKGYLPAIQEVRGTIVSIDTAYAENYNNITVTIQVPGSSSTIQCFRLAGGQDLKEGDTITVVGKVQKYGTKVQFIAGSTYTK